MEYGYKAFGSDEVFEFSFPPQLTDLIAQGLFLLLLAQSWYLSTHGNANTTSRPYLSRALETIL